MPIICSQHGPFSIQADSAFMSGAYALLKNGKVLLKFARYAEARQFVDILDKRRLKRRAQRRARAITRRNRADESGGLHGGQRMKSIKGKVQVPLAEREFCTIYEVLPPPLRWWERLPTDWIANAAIVLFVASIWMGAVIACLHALRFIESLLTRC